MSEKYSIILILLLTIAKDLIWWDLVPIWQSPDEQAHFAQLQWYGEKRSLDIPAKNLSQEVALSEDLLGTRRDNLGNNKYTYHPEFNVDYTTGFTGKWEGLIDSQEKGTRTKMVSSEAAMYPPLYYLTALPFYNAVYDHGLIDRVYSVRLASVIFNILLVFSAYTIGTIIFGPGIMSLVLAGLVAFHPMLSFVAAGIHPDNLLNLLYTAGLLICLLILKNGIKIPYLFWLAIVIFLGSETKQLMLLFIPVAAAAIIYQCTKKNRLWPFFTLAPLLLPLVLFFLPFTIPLVPRPTNSSPLANMDFVSYLQFRLGKALFEIWPWYWGVFKWLGVTLPPLTMKIITRLTILSGIGVLIYAFRIIRTRKMSFEGKAILFLAVSSVSYILYLFIWDWRLMQANGFSAGLQGRYFFPNIVSHMAILLIGLVSLFPKKWQGVRQLSASILLVFMVWLNFAALTRMAGSYYDLTSRKRFLMQVSQYKPQPIKWIAERLAY